MKRLLRGQQPFVMYKEIKGDKMKIYFETHSFEETEELGFHLGKLLPKSATVALVGDLGAGKTSITKGMARAFHIQENMTSPTFTIVNEHRGKTSLFHFDVYRVHDEEELIDLGFYDYIDSEGVKVIEWANLISNLLPSETIYVTLSKELLKGEDYREIEISFQESRFSSLLRLKG
jgi:tRNA threonylcarbamoyladenosine biosynthesis protein TsaE